MCGRFDTSLLTWADIHDQLAGFAPVSTAPLNLQPNDDVRPTTQQLFAHLKDGAWSVERGRWGLVPFFRNGKPMKDTAEGAGDGFRQTTFNAKAETVDTLKSYQRPFEKRRCVVPASGWYEWSGPKGGKTKHAFRRKDGGIVWFAGIWEHVTTPDEGEVTSFTILTGPPEGMLKDYHDRTPVVLELDDFGLWLDPAKDASPLWKTSRPERFARPAEDPVPA